jgi:hypothetical protein
MFNNMLNQKANGRYCECGRRAVAIAHSRHARRGYICRPRHDLCPKCWRSLRDQMRSMMLVAAIRALQVQGNQLNVLREGKGALPGELAVRQMAVTASEGL